MVRIYALVFALSGISGLIYESVWSHYVKLILGHAAFAQTLVLAIFMGGMAVGSWLASRVSQRLRSLLLAYAAVELAIGMIAIVFQPLFEASTRLLFDAVLPAMEPGAASMATKLTLATLLILPQSLLLGATFPLISGGVLRLDQKASGGTVSLLYFANSIGAVIGVLWSGFWLISAVGLPGTLLVAGSINVGLAFLVLGLVKFGEKEAIATPGIQKDVADGEGLRWILWAAAITGAASFCYEIAWIRMLSMVLGASTHSFELMLAAFILGLALGGLWIRRRIDTLPNPKLFLGIVQLVMGSLALATLPFYNHSFDIMAAAMQGLSRTDSGYVMFSLTGHAIAMLVMLPATFCAGMTLPLLTLILWRSRCGERAIGQVYAANTLGAIVGVITAVHLVLPAVGLKGLVLFGTLLDGALGLYLIAGAFAKTTARRRYGWLTAFSLAWLACLASVEFDAHRMAGGVFRHATATVPEGVEILHWKDGKTASIGLLRDGRGHVEITTNGKTDATINVSGQGAPSPDEMTMAMAAVIPMLHTPQARTVANIGFGSGMTTHMLLAFPQVQRVDTIEIEPEMVRLARIGFEARVPRAFNDPRSKIFIDDARAHFSSHSVRYDLIVSEPSNPWVSGVASLFSEEFYRHVTRHLSSEGLFVQWLQMYETSIPIVASVVGALDSVFADYRVYATDNFDLLVVARPSGTIAPPDYRLLDEPAVRSELDRLGIAGRADIALRLVGSKALWSPMLAARGVPKNSDYFPFVDQNAARYRFLSKLDALPLADLGDYPVPVLEALQLRRKPEPGPVGASTFFDNSDNAHVAQQIRDYLLEGRTSASLPVAFWSSLATIREGHDCERMAAAKILALLDLSRRTHPSLTSREIDAVWSGIGSVSPCNEPGTRVGRWVAFLHALSMRDWPATARRAGGILAAEGSELAGPPLEILLLADLSARLATNDREGFLRTAEDYPLSAVQDGRGAAPLLMELVLAQARNLGWRGPLVADTAAR